MNQTVTTAAAPQRALTVLAVMCVGLILSSCTRETAGTDNVEPAQTTSQEDRPQAETPLVNFALPDVAGVTRQSSEWDGTGRLINFWATWCAPCRREIPLLKKAQAENEANNIQIIGIAVDFPEEVAAYAEEAQFNYPVLVGQEDAMAVAESSGVPFIGLPFTMIVSPSGRMLKAHVGEIHESHITDILTVFDDLENGRIDEDGARNALATL